MRLTTVWSITISSPVKALYATTLILLITSGGAIQAAETLPLTDFLRDLRDQLLSLEQQTGEHPVPAVIKNVHVEMHVIAETDEQGRTAYFVLTGLPEKKEVVTQKLSFDLELHSNAGSTRQGKRYRRYSTRPNDNAYRQREYGSGRHRHYPPEHYMPDIYPVILYGKER